MQYSSATLVHSSLFYDWLITIFGLIFKCNIVTVVCDHNHLNIASKLKCVGIRYQELSVIHIYVYVLFELTYQCKFVLKIFATPSVHFRHLLAISTLLYTVH